MPSTFGALYQVSPLSSESLITPSSVDYNRTNLIDLRSKVNEWRI